MKLKQQECYLLWSGFRGCLWDRILKDFREIPAWELHDTQYADTFIFRNLLEELLKKEFEDAKNS